MGTLSLSRPDSDETGSRILDAAFAQFERTGIRRTSIDDVARRAKVGRVTVFRKFESKDGLIGALVLREAQRMMNEVDAAVGEFTTVEDQIVERFHACFTAARGHPLVTALLETEPELILPLLTVDGAPAIAIGRVMLERHLADAHVPDAREVADLLVRIGLSLLLTPTDVFALQSDDEIRAFARRYLVPIVTTHTAA